MSLAPWSKQMELCARSTLDEKLSKIKFVDISFPSTIVESEKDRAKVLRDILQWIALCFAPDTEDLGDNVAASMTITESCITMHLSDDKGSSRTPHYMNVENELLMSSSTAWANQMASSKASTGTGYNVKSDLHLFEATLIRLHWTSILRIMHEFKAEILFSHGQGIQERFNELVDRWEKHCQETNCAGDGTANLKSNLAKLIEGPPSNHSTLDENAKLHLYQVFKAACIAIDNSNFFHHSLFTATPGLVDIPWFSELDKRDRFFLQTLRKRCRSLCIYSTGAQKYLSTALSHFHKQSGRSSTDIKSFLEFEWIGDKDNEVRFVPKELTWPEASIPFITSVVKSSTDRDIAAAVKGRNIDEYFTEMWKKGDKVKVRVHCEVAMLYYLKKNNIDVELAAIGTARQSCYNCNIFAEGVVSTRNGRWKLQKTTSFHRGDWIIPQVNSGPHKLWLDTCFERVEQICKTASEDAIAGHMEVWKEEACISV